MPKQRYASGRQLQVSDSKLSATRRLREYEPWLTSVASVLIAVASVVVGVVAVSVSSQQTTIMDRELKVLSQQSSLLASQTAVMEADLELQTAALQPVFDISYDLTPTSPELDEWVEVLTVTNNGSPFLNLNVDVYTVMDLTVGRYRAENPGIPVAAPGYFFDQSLIESQSQSRGIVAVLESEGFGFYEGLREWNDEHPTRNIIHRPNHYLTITYRDLSGSNHSQLYEIPPMGGSPSLMDDGLAADMTGSYEELIEHKQSVDWSTTPEQIIALYEQPQMTTWAMW